MTLAISIFAICISLASLAFSFYQYKNARLVKQLQKTNDVLKQSYRLRRSSQDLRNIINSTDDIGDCEEHLDSLDEAIENQISEVLNKNEITISDIYMLEKKLLNLELEFELFSKQIREVIKFKQEVDLGR